jgi:outer membrane protein TolC
VDGFASVGNSGNKLVNGSGDYAVGVSLTFTLFDAGRRHRIDAAEAEKLAAEAARDERANELRLDVARAYEDFVAARERLSVTTKAMEQAEEVLRVVRDRYQAGLTTVTEVLRAETALVRSRLNHLSVRYAHTVGYARLLLASGALTDVAPFAR